MKQQLEVSTIVDVSTEVVNVSPEVVDAIGQDCN